MAFWRTLYHLVWATKNRFELIRPDQARPLIRYLVDKAAESGVHVFAVGACPDHIHLLVAIPPKHAVAGVVKRLKGSSSYYLNASGLSPEPFAWQRGYGVLTLGESQLPRAEAYVRSQKEHHSAGTANRRLERIGEDDREDDGSRPGALREDQEAYVADDLFP